MRRAWLLILGAALAGCGSSTTKQVRLSIKPDASMNDARSCYVLARTVDDKAYGIESYDDVAAKAMSPDASVQRAVVVVPGVSQEINLSVPEKGRIAIYALFKQPEDDGWRVLLPATAPEKAEIRLGRARMCWASQEAPKGATGVCGRGTAVTR